jgi:2-polyprenyl-6-methoxyphenol hydroxylase-like FAD-dependent oxidoreductase
MRTKTITILGGGIGGLTTAIALQRIGIRATVFEAAPEFRPLGAGIQLAANAMQGFRKLDIAEKIVKRGRLLPAFSILDDRGKTISHADARHIGAKYGVHNFAIHRADLHEVLAGELPPGQLRTGKRAIGFDRNGVAITVHFQDGTTHETDGLIAADGIHSAIRQQLLPDSAPRYAGYTCWRAVVDAGTVRQDFASESWGTAGRFGIVPLAGNRIYWFACVNAPAGDPAMRDSRVTDLQQIFRRFHAPVQQILAQTNDSDLIWSDIIDLKPVSRYAFDNILLLGDAAHATTPNMGQGACQAIEDAVILADELSKAGDLETAFSAFEKRRMKRTHFIVNTSWSLGKMAQWSHPWLAAMRNTLLRMIPDSVNELQLQKMLATDF